jgi:O-antigen ligase
VLESAVFGALLLLLVIAAVAYGGSEPWMKSALISLIFGLGAIAAIEFTLSDNRPINGLPILLPIVVLIAFSLTQTIPAPGASGAPFGIGHRLWKSLSADPYETTVFAWQLAGLALFAGLLFRYLTNARRISILLHTIIGIAVVSALFGLARQTMQHQPGFLFLPYYADQGYGQFLNRNHFAYLMEVGLGLILGLVAAGGVRRQRALIYLAAFLPIWTALVLANSRGGILSMVVQVVATLLLLSFVVSKQQSSSAAESLLSSPKVRLPLLLALLVLIVVGMAWVGGDRLATRIETAQGEFSDSEQVREGVTRWQIWRDTMHMFAANPIAGVGMGGYWAAIPTYHQAPGNMTPQQAHSDYLEVLASGGILGTAIVVWFIAGVLRKARLNLRGPNRFARAACFAALIAMIGIGVHSLVDFGLHRMANALIFTALIVIATCNVTSIRGRQSEDV